MLQIFVAKVFEFGLKFAIKNYGGCLFMTEFLKKLTANRIIVSAVCLILGLLCVIIPNSILPAVSLIFGICLLVYAIYQLVNILAVKDKSIIGFSAVFCALSFIVGLVLILNHDVGTLMVGVVTGIWALIAGLVHLGQVFMLHKMKMTYVDTLVKSIAELVVAILMFVNMNAMVALQIIILGALLILYAVYQLCVYFRLVKTAKEMHETHQEATAKSADENTEIIIEDNENETK